MAEENPTPIVLAIDDSELIHHLLKTHLQGESLELHSAMSCEEGLKKVIELNPDLILLDISMDGMNGFELLKKLKEDPHTQNIYVILISGLSESVDREKGFDMGAFDFITKPLNQLELKASVRNALRMKMLEQMTQRDGPTGLWNQVYFKQRMIQEISEARRHSRPLSLVVCDMDRFKKLNDKFGHQFGSHVLEKIAQILSGGRTSDIVCRYAGDEFVLILPSTNIQQGYEVVERIRTAIAAVAWPNKPNLAVTASFGICDTASVWEEVTPETMFQAADSALYKAKESGRNNVRSSSKFFNILMQARTFWGTLKSWLKKIQFQQCLS
ncbi:MAG: diguanylate cyclase [Bacteroidota bacterium]